MKKIGAIFYTEKKYMNHEYLINNNKNQFHCSSLHSESKRTDTGKRFSTIFHYFSLPRWVIKKEGHTVI